MVGYFLNYNQLNCCLLNNSTERLDSISFVNSKKSKSINFEEMVR